MIGIKFCILFQDYMLYNLILELRRDRDIFVLGLTFELTGILRQAGFGRE